MDMGRYPFFNQKSSIKRENLYRKQVIMSLEKAELYQV